MKSIVYRSKLPSDDPWIKGVATKLWGEVEMVTKDHIYNLLALPNIVAECDGKPVAFIMYAKEGQMCEIVALYSSIEKQGIGTALIDTVKKQATKDGCIKLWLLTTNDNLDALSFYKKRGFVVTATRKGEIDRQREKKPEIPKIGFHGIPIHDEIELEQQL
jgi:ribosomal protein S18 acetylase RimI-like enzyme